MTAGAPDLLVVGGGFTGLWTALLAKQRNPERDVLLIDLHDQPLFDGGVETRAIGATFNGVRVWSVYVPNGRELGHDHFHYKLDWLDALKRTVADDAGDQPFAVIGDFNIAPEDRDVHDPKAWDGQVLVSAAERAARAIRAARNSISVWKTISCASSRPSASMRSASKRLIVVRNASRTFGSLRSSRSDLS